MVSLRPKDIKAQREERDQRHAWGFLKFVGALFLFYFAAVLFFSLAVFRGWVV